MLSDRLKELRIQHGLSQVTLAEKLEISNSLYNSYEKRNVRPPYEILSKLAEIYGVSVDYILNPEDGRNNLPPYKNVYPLEPYIKLPVLGVIRAGQPICTDQGDYDWEYADASYGDGNHFMLRIQGDSMSPTIPDGSIAIIRKQDTAEKGQIVAFAMDGEYATLKRYFPQPDGNILLRGDNPQAQVYLITPQMIANGDCHVIGVCRSYKVNL